MERVALLVHQGLEHLQSLFPSDNVEYEELKRSFEATSVFLRDIIKKAALVEHTTMTAWRANNKMEGPCPCAHCDAAEEESRVAAVDAAFEEVITGVETVLEETKEEENVSAAPLQKADVVA